MEKEKSDSVLFFSLFKPKNPDSKAMLTGSLGATNIVLFRIPEEKIKENGPVVNVMLYQKDFSDESKKEKDKAKDSFDI